MGDVEIHADYDRDGRLTGRESEYAARTRPPGAILGINVDRDGRTLPPKPQVGDRVALDHERPTRLGNDDELLPIEVRISKNAVEAYDALLLRINATGSDAILLDDGRRAMTPVSAFDYPLPRTAGAHRFYLEASKPPSDSGAFTVSAHGLHAGEETLLDTGHFRVAPLILLSDHAPAETVFICRCPDNEPAITDVKEAIGELLKVVPEDDCASDAWVQDQFQLGYVSTPQNTMRALLHMPRMRKNAEVNPGTKNLAELVRGHFPSTDLGLIQDLWAREVDIPQVPPYGLISVPLESTLEIYRALKSVSLTASHLAALVDRLSHALQEPVPLPPAPPEEPSIIYPLGEMFRLQKVLRALAPKVSEKYGKGQIGAMLERADAKVNDAFSHVDTVAMTVRVKLKSPEQDKSKPGPVYYMTDQDAAALLEKLEVIHDSLVYGGNVEVSPPLPGAPFGKVILGTSSERPMDPEVRKMFGGPNTVQPVVELDTSRLAVAHIDELISFVPGKGAQPPVIFRASPEVALRLMLAAGELYESAGGVQTWAAFEPLPLLRHDMNKGKHPITRMFRGKYWLHEHPPRESEWTESSSTTMGAEPPNLYLNLVDWHAKAGEQSPARYHPGSRLRRDYYRAKLTIWEFMYFEENEINELLKNFMLELDVILGEELPPFPIRRVPVLFDDAQLEQETPPQLAIGATSAFTPNLVNLQCVGDKVLIPNPFGPRMAPEDAAQVIRTVLREQKLDGLASMVTPAFFAKQKLDRLAVWMNKKMDGEGYEQTIRTIGQVAEEFTDAFSRDTLQEEIEAAILDANKDAFHERKKHPEEDPQAVFPKELKDGWHCIKIPGQSVDLFQAYTHALLVAQGCTPVWIDTWYYHVRHGEIHCGTNVLRSVPREGRKWW